MGTDHLIGLSKSFPVITNVAGFERFSEISLFFNESSLSIARVKALYNLSNILPLSCAAQQPVVITR